MEQIVKLFCSSWCFLTDTGKYAWSQDYLTVRQEVNLVSVLEQRK